MPPPDELSLLLIINLLKSLLIFKYNREIVLLFIIFSFQDILFNIL